MQTSMLTEYCRRVARSLARLSMAEKKLTLEALSIEVRWYPDSPWQSRDQFLFP